MREEGRVGGRDLGSDLELDPVPDPDLLTFGPSYVPAVVVWAAGRTTWRSAPSGGQQRQLIPPNWIAAIHQVATAARWGGCPVGGEAATATRGARPGPLARTPLSGRRHLAVTNTVRTAEEVGGGGSIAARRQQQL